MKQGTSLGIDIGGTFTDIVVYDHATQRRCNHKELTTPEDPVLGVVRGIRKVFDGHQLDYGAVQRVVHATTLFTNALIERRGAKTGLLVTQGFRDVLEIRRENKYELYDLKLELPRPLVPRSLCAEVPERMSAEGEVLLPLDLAALEAQVDNLVKQGVQ